MSREIDARVAELVMGWKPDKKNSGAWIPPGKEPLRSGYYTAQPGSFTTDPAADYEVLKHVREKWGSTAVGHFIANLGDMWGERGYNCALWYQPGDYNKAALLALGESIG